MWLHWIGLFLRNTNYSIIGVSQKQAYDSYTLSHTVWLILYGLYSMMYTVWRIQYSQIYYENGFNSV